MSEKGRGHGAKARGSRGGSRRVLAGIDERLIELDAQLERYYDLVEERARLVAARAALTGERSIRTPTGARRLSGDEVAAYLRAHPGARAGEIAAALEVPLTNVSQHLYRGKHERFEPRGDGWHVREAQGLDRG